MARSAMALTQAIFICSLMQVAPTSRAPRNRYGKQMTLLTWLGRSERPVAMIASGRAFFATSGGISGTGLARAMMMGLVAMFLSMPGFSTFPTDRPRNTSACLIAAPSVLAFVEQA